MPNIPTEYILINYISVIRTKIDQHIHLNKQDNELQAGFKQIKDKLFLLNYCIEKSFKMKKKIITIAIDFSKAFDSIKRKSLTD